MKTYHLSEYLPEGSELGYGDFFVGKTKCINVLLVGRSQTGKSTLVETLLSPQDGISGTGFSDTKDPGCINLILTNKDTKETYQLNIIDTPGLREVRENEESRTDEQLLKLASNCVENHITSLNMVCFISRAGETHTLDTEVFEKVKAFLGDKYSEVSMMVLTHCDEFNDEDLCEFEKSIRSHKFSKPCFDYCKLGILRYGAVDFKKLKSYKETVRKGIVEDKLERIEEMRNIFLNKVISCTDKGLKIAELQQIYEESRAAHQKAVQQGMDNLRKQQDETKKREEEAKRTQGARKEKDSTNCSIQ